MPIIEKLREVQISRLDLTDFARCVAETPVAEVLRMMRTEKVSAVLIVEGDRLVGIFTERDVLLQIADTPSTWPRPVGEFMSEKPQVMRPDRPISEALHLMNEGHYRHVPILDAEGSVVGSLPQHELIRFLTDQYPREVYNLPPDPDRIATTKEGA